MLILGRVRLSEGFKCHAGLEPLRDKAQEPTDSIEIRKHNENKGH